MYELKNGSARLATALATIKDDPTAIKMLAHALNYIPEQLEQDIRALYDYRILLESWSNNAASGYAITAAQAIGLDHRQTADLIAAMQRAYDDIPLSDASDLYESSDY